VLALGQARCDDFRPSICVTVFAAATQTGAQARGAAPQTGAQARGAATQTGAQAWGAATQTGAQARGAATQTGAQARGAATQTGAQARGAATQTGAQARGAAPQTGTQARGAATQTGAQAPSEPHQRPARRRKLATCMSKIQEETDGDRSTSSTHIIDHFGTTTGAQERRDKSMATHSPYRSSPKPITNQSFNVGLLAGRRPARRIKALNDFFDDPDHLFKMADLLGWWPNAPTDADLYQALHRVVKRGRIRFTSLVPAEMRAHWDRVIMQRASFLRKNARRSDRRHAQRVERYAAMKALESGAGETLPDTRDPAEGSCFDVACRDLQQLIMSVEPQLTCIERRRLEAFLHLMDETASMPSQRDVARVAQCSKSSIGNLLKRIRDLAPQALSDRWSEDGV
jgi:hypothetical protein